MLPSQLHLASPPPYASRLPSAGDTSAPQRNCNQKLRTWSAHYHRRPELPHDVLAEVFTYLRESVTLVYPKSLRQEEEEAEIAVGPPMHITRVSRFWREVAMSCPLLWSTIPILLESRTVQALANPGQVMYYLQRAQRTPLSLVIGARHQLMGTGVKGEVPLKGHTLDFLATLATRVRKMAIAFAPESDILPILSKCNDGLSNLESLAVVGANQSPMLLELAGFWKSALLCKVVWGISESHTVALPHFFANPWDTLTEVFMADDWSSAIPASSVHAFFTAAKGLRAFRGRVCNCAPDEDPSLCHELPTLQHNSLQTLSLTFQASVSQYTGPPALLLALRLPHLRSFSFNLHRTAQFDPVAVTQWLTQDSQHCLTTFECLVGLIDTNDLMSCLRAMPFLQVLKCTGVLPGSRQLDSPVIDASKAIIDQRFLRALATSTAYDVGLGQSVSVERVTEAEKMPCPLLREIYFTNASLGRFQMNAFLKARTYGPHPYIPKGANLKLTPLSRFAIDNLIEANSLQVGRTWDRVFRMRRFMERWRRVHGVEVSVTRLMDENRELMAGSGDDYVSPQLSPEV